MNFQVYKPELPQLILNYNDLTAFIEHTLADFTGSFDFNTLINTLANRLITTGFGFNAEPNTTYAANLQLQDQALIREVIWDFIVLRYVTIGSYGKDTWPSLTITQRGIEYFSKFK